MLTFDRFVARMKQFHDRREFKAMLSWAEQGIYTLANQEPPQVDPYDDDTPLTSFPIDQRTINDLDDHGLVTVGQLRRVFRDQGRDALYFLGHGQRVENLCVALRNYDERQGSASIGRSDAIRSQP